MTCTPTPTLQPSVGSDAFREAMSTFPSGVTLVTTTDASGEARGFTATSFCSVSENPPLVLVCLAKSARCHAAFEDADAWMIHILQPRKQKLAYRFASSVEDKFAGEDFERDASGLPALQDVPVRLACAAHSRYSAGDHTVLVGRVYDVALGPDDPAVYFKRKFHGIAGRLGHLRGRPMHRAYADAVRMTMFE
jgi:flavin reductase ActVB